MPPLTTLGGVPLAFWRESFAIDATSASVTSCEMNGSYCGIGCVAAVF